MRRKSLTKKHFKNYNFYYAGLFISILLLIISVYLRKVTEAEIFIPLSYGLFFGVLIFLIGLAVALGKS